MQNTEILEKIKRYTISALVADEVLMGMLVLKGGNALNLAYEITNRGSLDIDFSIEKDFTDEEKRRLQNQIDSLLQNEFTREGLKVFDVKFFDRPQKINESVKSFWGGYLIEFKVIEEEKYNSLNGDKESIRRNAIPLHIDNSTKFTIDISKYEYIAGKKMTDMEGAIVYVYTPEMLAIEKLRALCQQVPDYKDIVISITPKSRARDFYDIYNITQSFNIDYTIPENVELCKHIFDAKRVPLNYIQMLNKQKEFHRQSWESVVSTVDQKEKLKSFDYYFDFVLEQFKHIKNL